MLKMMITSSSNTHLLFFSSSSSPSHPLLKLKPSLPSSPFSSSSFPTNQTPHLIFTHHRNNNTNNKRQSCCKAVFTDDAPFAAAIGACMLTSLVFPIPSDDEEDDVTDSTTDTRLAVMGILSFVPYFNWLSWVFAWLDTGNRRYALYSLVYLVPYLRTNLSLSPEESWLPIASILFCIVHIQLEASIRNGDIQGFQLFRSQQSSRKKADLNRQQQMFDEGSKKDNKNLPSAQELSRGIGDWEDSQRPLRQRLNEDSDDDGDRNKH